MVIDTGAVGSAMSAPCSRPCPTRRSRSCRSSTSASSTASTSGRDGIDVAILPTFVGCPALDVIRASIGERLAERFDRPVRVETTFEVPWTSDRISTAGRAALREAGIAPPGDPRPMRCPFCDSADVVMDSAFGPTQCRSLFYCRGCRQPFEALKSV